MGNGRITKNELSNNFRFEIEDLQSTVGGNSSQLTEIAKQTTEESTTPSIYNSSPFFQVGKGTDAEGNDVGDTYKDSIVNGQITDCRLEGKTLKNELNYNRETWEEWIKVNAIPDGVGIELSSDGEIIIDTNFKTNTKYGVLLNVISNNVTTRNINAQWCYNTTVPGISPNVTGNIKIINNTTSDVTQNVFKIYTGTLTVDEKIKFKNVRMFELTTGSEIENDFETLTADELAEKYPYIEGNSPKSTLMSWRHKNIGKNLSQEKFYKMTYSANGFFTPSESTEIYTKGDKFYYTNEDRGVGVILKVNGGETLTLKVDDFINSHGIILITEYASKGDAKYPNAFINANVEKDKSQVTVTLNQSTRYIIYGVAVNYTYRNDGGFLSWGDVQLEEGATATDYEPYEENLCYVTAYDSNGKIVNLGSLVNVKDKFREINGKSEVEKNVVKVILDGSDTFDYISDTNYVGFKRVNIAKLNPEHSMNSNAFRLIDSAGFSYPYGATISDTAQLHGVDSQILVIWISNTRSGFKDEFNPTSADWKNFFANNNHSLTYQLQNPIYIPCTIKGDFYAYKDGHTEITPYISKEFVYTDNKITLPYAVEGVDILLNKKGEEVEKDNYTLADDGLSLTVTGATNEDIFMVYTPIRKELNATGTFSGKYLTGGVKSQVEQLNKGQQELYSDVMSVQDQIAMIIVTSS